jgi:hypothetical protein
MNAPVTLQALQQPRQAVAMHEEDYTVDLFSVRGFKLAHRLAETFASSDAVPAIFRSQTVKKDRDGNMNWVDNPSAIGNCVVAIETARTVGVSITAVMQHANIIEGRLSWSAQFVIAAINASGRFTPLRFDIKSRGPISATYREKQGWNKAKGGFDFVDKTVDVEDLVCVAWALPAGFKTPAGVYTLAQARAQQLPVIESAPVSMKMAVEEGWYSKPGSKWQTEMKHQMLQYRAGAFFGRIHAPDVVMGMGRTSEEVQDMTTVDVAADGSVTAVRLDEVQRNGAAPAAEVVQRVDQPTGEVAPPAPKPEARPEPEPEKPKFDHASMLSSRFADCKTRDQLDNAADLLRADGSVPRAILNEAYDARMAELNGNAATDTPAPRTRRTGNQQPIGD